MVTVNRVSCSDVFVKRHSFSLRLDMSPADGGDGGSRKALFSPDEMDGKNRRCDSTTYEREPRLVLKSGILNAQEVNVEEKGQRYFADIFTTLVDMRWRWTMFYFCIVYVLSWFGFAVIWWTILISHGDMDHFEEENWQPCVVGVKSFSSVFLFSLESQHTIGYGHHRMTDICPEAIALLSLQSIAGVLIEALSVGVFIVKLSKPKKRSQTLIFSKNAMVCQKEGKMYLKFRMADIRHESKLLETHVRAQVVYKKTAPDGEVESIVQKEIEVGALEEDEDRILLYWPTTIVHEINEDSPFYEMSCDDLAKAQGSNGSGGNEWELIVVLEGVVESTGMTTQARTSYLPSEILWGRKFRSMMKSKGGAYLVDFDLFNSTISCDDTPLCSAKAWESQNQHQDSCSSSGSSNGVTEADCTGNLDHGDGDGNTAAAAGGNKDEANDTSTSS
ncbi:unnamed protein product [Orchesella dallaii]|uniref:Uncharacterized protein n=1 Tax=Orchesella dallaii TaxID=48710 RepID=A0ABP1S2M7_9HEXA